MLRKNERMAAKRIFRVSAELPRVVSTGNNQCVGLCLSPRQYSRKASNSFRLGSRRASGVGIGFATRRKRLWGERGASGCHGSQACPDGSCVSER
jgi:hypothetical protein